MAATIFDPVLAVGVRTGRTEAAGPVTLPGVALALFLAAFIFDPGGGLGLKYATVLLAGGAILACRLGSLIPSRFFLIEFPLFFAVPLILWWVSFAVFHVPLADSLSRVTPAATFFVLPLLIGLPAARQDAIFRRTIVGASILLIAAFIVLYAMIFAGEIARIVAISTWMNDRQIGFFGLRPEFLKQGLSIPNVYFRWSMVLVAGLIVCGTGRRRDLMVIGLAALVSISTGVILFGFGGLAIYALARLIISPRVRGGTAAFGIALLAAGLVAVPLVAEVATTALDKLTGSNDSTAIKLGHMRSVLDEIARDPAILLWGMGLGSDFYSVGVEQFVNAIEVSQFDMVRQFGLVYLLAFTLYVSWLVVANWQRDAAGQRWAIAMVMMYVAAATNPLLYSPVYFLVLAFARARLVQRSEHALTAIPG